jgi:hypothetical protein
MMNKNGEYLENLILECVYGNGKFKGGGKGILIGIV